MRKKLPIGIDGFEKIRTNDFYYVDKTLFIKELVENWGEVNLFTRPRRFGKTLNMSMLKSFFEAGSDPALFEGLAIDREEALCREFMVTGLRTLAAKKQVVISADRWGKIKTALQMMMLAIAGASWVWEFELRQEKWFSIRLWYVWIAYLCGIVLVTVGSGAAYFVRYRSLYLGDAAGKKA